MSYPCYFDPSTQIGAEVSDSTLVPATIFYNRRGERIHPSGRLPEHGPARTRCRPPRDGGVRRWLREGPLAPEIRVDPLTGHRTIVAGERSRRPGGEPRCTSPEPIDVEQDPFAEGHEDRTPPELYAVRPGGGPPDSPGWTVRVVPNLFPALTVGVPPREEPHASTLTPPPIPTHPIAGGSPGAAEAAVASAMPAPDPRPDLFAAMPATGAHEVIVNAPQSVYSLGGAARGAGGVGRRGVAGADARPRGVRVRAADRQRASRGGGVAAAHARAAIRAGASCRPTWRASASAPGRTRRARWAANCSRISSPRRCAGASGWWRSTRRRC